MENNNLNSHHTENMIILIILGALILTFLAITSLPALIISIFFTIPFLFIKVNKLLFTLIGFIVAFLVNLKISLAAQFFISSINFIKVLFNALIHKNDISITYKNYIVHINIFWQIVLAFIIASIIAHIISIAMNKEEHSSEAIKERAVNKALDKIKGLKHENGYTTIGIEYEDLLKVKVEDKAKHIAIAGTTGAGKTVTIANFIENAMQKDYPILAVDGKGDLDKGSLLDYMKSLSKKYNRKLYVINFVNPHDSDYYNPFLNAGMTEAKDMLISMNEWSEEHYKVNTERYLQQLIRVLNMQKIKLDLNTIINYSPSQFQKLVEEMKDNENLSIEEYTKLSEIIESTGPIANSAMARFATTAESEAGILFKSSGIDIYTAMKEKSNILIILDTLSKPQFSKQVGKLAVLDARKAVSKLFGDKTRKFFIFDEFNVYASDTAVDLLNKSRSSNTTCIPAFQSLSDLDKAGGTSLRNQIIDNCNNYIIMRQNGADSSTEWERIIGEEEKIQYTYSIERKTGIFSSGNKITGTGSMHNVMESKIKATEIQNFQTGQAIFLSKDQRSLNKIKVRSINLNLEEPLNKNNNTLSNNEVIKTKDIPLNKDLKKTPKAIDIKTDKINVKTKENNDNDKNKNEFADVEDILKD
ncbi:type IV secretory system conjugative DNA transfer family protein [Clostridium pasteurianum]|uniref:Type IV secretory pathway, VirD4 component n=1 Tax=Clostridium pasteurianum BC1 TaxID=86416 RepID=R4K232_CLOPA|nr:type IV secretion system DNA-binding domain-containing protein [Clostridium pasteurianum]AGK96623.1 type IV secretory pathway, VirD4 component [Clostridium pasteurianum BC1]